MKRWRSVQCYYKGEVETLDKKQEKYKNKQIFVGDAWSEALTDKEVDNLADIQKKKRIKPRKLTFAEVSTYVELSEKIIDYRKRVKREAARFRKMRSRDKLTKAAKAGNRNAIKRIKAIKKTNIERIYKKRKNKKQSTDQSSRKLTCFSFLYFF